MRDGLRLTGGSTSPATRRPGRGSLLTFTGRDDDPVNSAGYRIGPFEVESELIAHPAVAEAAVIGAPDPLRGEVVKAFVVLRPDATANEALAEELQRFIKRELSAHAFPQEVTFLDALPKTPSGKILTLPAASTVDCSVLAIWGGFYRRPDYSSGNNHSDGFHSDCVGDKARLKLTIPRAQVAL